MRDRILYSDTSVPWHEIDTLIGELAESVRRNAAETVYEYARTIVWQGGSYDRGLRDAAEMISPKQ
jgi:hypothetical protein